ncbi:hypothetical protein Pcinc_013999 [Petrolisthes cinctipes]|uniref:Uncharacterized protein n=1 Tax=Petrolisthes cinctipes TaxID=88211 RepID=A0AAE1FXD9_PETCI|nr:hypothetical protein Pcinc_013999 [Petrolisthes cinctipes]
MGANLLHSKLRICLAIKSHIINTYTTYKFSPWVICDPPFCGNKFPLSTTTLRYMYLQKLPPQVRITLAALDSTTTDLDFALAADRMLTQLLHRNEETDISLVVWWTGWRVLKHESPAVQNGKIETEHLATKSKKPHLLQQPYRRSPHRYDRHHSKPHFPFSITYDDEENKLA